MPRVKRPVSSGGDVWGDAVGIYISGGDSQVHINDSQITVSGQSSRANAILLGKTRVYGTGSGKLYSTGNMQIDTTTSPNSQAVNIIYQGALLDANADTSRTTIKSANQAITINANTSGTAARALTETSFNNLVANTTSTTADLISVTSAKVDYLLNVRGSDSNLTASAGGYIVNVANGTSANSNAATFNFAEGKMRGLVNKGTNATLNLNVSNNAQWILATKSGATPTTATFNQLNLSNKAQVIAYGAGDGNAKFTLAGNVASDAGILNLSNAGNGSVGAAGDILTIKGNYVGSNNAVLSVDTFLGVSGSKSDRLVIDGGTISGQTLVRFNNVDTSDAGGATEPGHGIKFVRAINGGTTAADAFVLDPNGPGAYSLAGQTVVGAGAYAYTMFRGANPTAPSATSDEYGETDIASDWYLRSQLKPKDPEPPVVNPPVVNPPVINPPVVTPPLVPEGPIYQAGVPSYEAYPQALLGLNGLPTLQQRVGNRFWAGAGNRVISEGADAIVPYASPEEAGVAIEGNGVWGRIVGGYNHFESRFSTTGTDFNQNIFELQAGIDGLLSESEDGKLIGGITAHYKHGKTRTSSFYGDGDISTDGYGLGGTLTWYGNEGFYIDGQAQVTWYNSDLNSLLANRGLTSGNDGIGYALSIETGKRYALNREWSLTPQAQLIYSSVDFDDFRDPFHANVSLDKGDSLQGRLGLTLDHENSWQNDRGFLNRTHVYGIANLYYEFLDGTRVDVSGLSVSNRQDRLWGGLGMGGSYNWDNDKYSIYGEGLVTTSLNNFGDSYGLKGQVGFRVKW